MKWSFNGTRTGLSCVVFVSRRERALLSTGTVLLFKVIAIGLGRGRTVAATERERASSGRRTEDANILSFQSEGVGDVVVFSPSPWAAFYARPPRYQDS